MIGDDAMARRLLAFGGHAGEIDRGADQRAEKIDGVIVMGALQHSGDALQPHAGVDRRAREIGAATVLTLLVLHEDEIPDLDEAIAIGIRAAGRAAPKLGTVIVKDLRAGPARTRVAHGPEIVAAGDAQDLAVGKARDLAPECSRLIVIGEDGDQQPLLVESEILGDQIPRKLDRALLEIIAEGEVTEHLEEGVVARGEADVLEIVVLAAGANAFLRRRGARIGRLLGAGEDVLERHHARIGEHERGIVARHKGTGRHDLVIQAAKELEKARADVVHARRASTAPRSAGAPGRCVLGCCHDNEGQP